MVGNLPDPLMDDKSPPDGGWISIEGILTTNDAIKAYDGIVRLSDAALYDIVERVNSGRIPFSGHHDTTRRIRSRNVRAWVDVADHERLLARFSADVVRFDWEQLGEVRGMSYSAFAPLDGEQLAEKSDMLLSFGADASWFSDEAISLAAESIQLPSNGLNQPVVTGTRLFQFSIVVDPRIIVETSILLWQALGPNLVASALWDGLKLLLARRRIRHDAPVSTKTSIEIHLTTPQGGHLSALIRTDDTTVAKQAVAKLPNMTDILMSNPDGNSTHEWTPETGGDKTDWKWNKLH
jgi:hypothetical protein